MIKSALVLLVTTLVLVFAISCSEDSNPVASDRNRTDLMDSLYIVGSCSECRGLSVAVSGNYAYSASGYNGLLVSDITSPASPLFVSHADADGYAVDVAVSGDYAYIATIDPPVSNGYANITVGNRGLKVIDISNPSLPSVVGSVDTPLGSSGVAVYGDCAYTVGHGGFYVIDIKSPSSPMIVGFVDTSGDPTCISIFSEYAYIADGLLLHVVDISNPSLPSIARSIDTPYLRSRMTFSGHYAYVVGGDGLHVLDVRFPRFPRIVKCVEITGQPMDIAISGNYAFVTDHWVGLQLIDIKSPGSPVIIGSFDTPLAYGIAASGNYAYIVGHAGLQVLAIAYPTSYPKISL